MLADPQQSNLNTATFRKILQLLEGLCKTRAGAAIYSHIGQMLEAQESSQLRTEQTLCTLLRQLLDAYSMHLPRESSLYTQIKLLQVRLSPPLGASEITALRHYMRNNLSLGKQATNNLTPKDVSDALDSLMVAFGVKPPGGVESEQEKRAYNSTPDSRGHAEVGHQGPGSVTNFRGKVERRTGMGASEYEPYAEDYAQHEAAGKPRVMGESASAQAILFERRRSGDRDAAVSQVAGVAHPLDDVSQAEITQSLAKTEEFGALLESGLANLRTVQDEGQFSKRKGEVLGELEKLLKSHRHLTSHFDKMVNYLSSIQTDSERLSEELSRVTMLSLTDELTGLPNRRAFIQRLRDEVARVQRYGHTLSLAIIDLDDFKPINDTYGHPAGDAVLNTYAKDVLTTFRRHDMVARYGGEEFALIFPYTETQGALQALKKIQSLAVATACRLEKTAIPLPTFSAGLAVYHRGESVDSLIKRADSALYSAKDLGRNRIEIA